MAKGQTNNQTQKRENSGSRSNNHQNQGLSTAAAGLVGAVAGAAVGVALSNKETREQILKVLDDVKDRSVELKDTLGHQAKQVKDEAMKTLSQTQDMMEDRDIKSRTDNLPSARSGK